MKLPKVLEIGGGGQICAFSALMLLATLAPRAWAGLRPWEPSDYVQTGLVLHFDGIRNAGPDAAHDSAATTWKDLSPSAKDATFNTAEDGSAWTADGYSFGGGSYATVSGKVTLGTVATVQAVTKTTIETLRESTGVNGNQWSMFIGGQSSVNDACNIYYNKGNKKFVFKNANGGNADLLQANWDGRYLTAIRNGNDKYLFSGAALPSSPAASGSQSAMGDVQFWLGSADGGSGSFAARYFKGPLNAVRLYSRVLDDGELAWNRAVDEARFFGVAIPESALLASAVPNAVVATAVPGAEGAETSGCYVVDDGGYTFRAPACATVGGVAYALSGCTVAQWNSATGDWDAAETRDGVFAVSVSSSDKVKITWQWEAATGSLDAGYVTEDLALRLDGIDNAGVGVHNASANVWKDLSGNGRDAFLAGNADDSSHWEDKGFYFNRNAVFATTAQFQLGNRYTIEGLVDSAKTDYPDAGVNGQVFCNSVNNLSNGNPSYYGNLYYHRNQGKWMFLAAHVTDAVWGAAHTTLTDATLSYFTAFRDGPLVSLTNSAALPPSGQWAGSAKDDVPPDDIWCFGANSATAVRSSNQWNFKGTVKSFRAYTRLLTDEELARNRAVDEARFFGKIPATGCVVVQSAIDGLEGREPSGAYFPDGWTFSAGAGTQTVRGIKWQCAGYQLQTWDAATSTWGAQQTVLRNGENAVEYTAAATSAALPSVRLTWLWKPVSGIRTAADYALADYAVGGLQLHLDGLLNTGAAHDSSATVWSDLSGNGRDATLAGNPSGESHWVDDGYFFASNAVFATGAAATFSLGHAYTMQVLGKVNFADHILAGVTHHGTYVSPIVDHLAYGSIWLKGDGMGTIQHHTSDTTGAAWNLRGSVFVGLDGHPAYLTALRNGNRAALVEGAAYPTTENTMAHQACMDWSVGSKDEAAPATRWGVGSSTAGGGGNPLYGTVKSIRLYDRMLSEDELAWNRNVDSARYFGELGVTNVLVRTKYGDVSSAAEEVLGTAPGAYTVEGSWTFSATQVKNDKGALANVAGYYTEELDATGNWTSRVWNEGTEYTYNTETEGGKTIRLTWSPQRPGMTVIVQ